MAEPHRTALLLHDLQRMNSTVHADSFMPTKTRQERQIAYQTVRRFLKMAPALPA